MEKLVTKLPGAIKEKGKTQTRKDKVLSKQILLRGNEVTVVVVVEANLVANKIDWVLDIDQGISVPIKSYSTT